MTTNLLPCGHEDYGVECLVCVPYGSQNPDNKKSMSELEQVAHLVIGHCQPINAETANKLARAALVMHEALLKGTDGGGVFWREDALYKAEEIMKGSV